jgi:preprotein translocase subunit SecD
MKRGWWYRFTFLIIVALVAGMSVVPTAFDFKETDNFPIKSKINLGLDLQGGLYMILGIDFKKVYTDEVKGFARRLEYALKDDKGFGLTVGDLDTTDPLDPKIQVLFAASGHVAQAKDLIHDTYNGYLRVTGEGDKSIQIALTKKVKIDIEDQSVKRSIEVIRNRIDEFGVTEPEIMSQGKDRIVVQLPGVKDIERAKELIGKTAKLEFKMVNSDIPMATISSWLEKAKKEGIEFKQGDRYSDYVRKINEYLKKDLPPGHMLAFEKKSNTKGEVTQMLPYVLESTSRLTGDDLEDARVQFGQQQNQPEVGMNFKSRGAKIFGELTGENIGKLMAIVLDGNVYSAPRINSKIPNGRASITLGSGNFNAQLKEAKDLALVLRAGALPVQLDFLEQRTVGPSLGHDSIEKARYASIIGAILVFAFIIVYYKISGAFAMVTLGLNIVIVLAMLVGLEATLTLPGIAGIALTIGMAVDANIIIYERIREEVRAGAGYYNAVESGFNSAFWTIIDANITTALAGICLLNFGSGPIRGFAVTLLIGIVATVYSAYFVSKLFFEFYMNKVEGQDLSI